MKILFWSPMHGQTGTTSNLLAAAMITGMHYRKKTVLTQTQFHYNNLEAPIVGANPYNQDSKDYFREVGVDTILRCYKAAELDRDTLENCCIALKDTNILLLPGTGKAVKEAFDYEMEAVMGSLLKAVEAIWGIVLVDLSAGKNVLSGKLMEEAELVVVNLSQNLEVTDEFFRSYAKKMPEKKVFYLFGKYDHKSKYNINNIRRRYSRIKPANSGVIPYHTGFMDSMVDGRVVEFMKRVLSVPARDDTGYFISRAMNATEKILRMAGVNIERA